MGNCLRLDRNLAGTKNSELEPDLIEVRNGIKTKGEEETSFGDESKVVRIKVVVTREELRQILGHKKGTNSVEHLAHVLKQRGMKISRSVHEEERRNGNWRPSLESIPEDHC